MATPRCSQNCPRVYVRASILGELLCLILFLVGPLGASIDCDGDGIPDVPVVVIASTPLAEISQTRLINVASMTAHDAPVVMHARLRSYPSGSCICRVNRLTRHLEIYSVCVLRC